jgi:site-specific recombinase XerC
VQDKSYELTLIGGDVARYLKALRWADKAQNTIDNYEVTLARLAVDFAHLQVCDLSIELLRDFLDEHWGHTAPATRRRHLAAVRSFLAWAVRERGLPGNPAASIDPPKLRTRERNAYGPEIIDRLIVRQPDLRDRIGCQLLGRLAFRQEELQKTRLIDFDLQDETVLVHGKGGKDVVLPLGSRQLIDDIGIYTVARNLDEYLIYSYDRATTRVNLATVHRWFKRCLHRAGLPDSIQMHEMRHSAAANLYRQSRDLLVANQLLRHVKLDTTRIYLHPNRDDLAQALADLYDSQRLRPRRVA